MNSMYSRRKRRGAGWARFLHSLTAWSWLQRFGWHLEAVEDEQAPPPSDDGDSRVATTMPDDEPEDDIEISQEDLEALLGLGISMHPPLEFFLESPERIRDLKRIFKFILEREEAIKQQEATEAQDATE